MKPPPPPLPLPRRQRRLHRLVLPATIAWRYMRGRRSRLLAATARTALVATTLGVTTMVVAMALMSGYTDEVKRKLIGLQGEVMASRVLGEDEGGLAERLRAAAAVPGVERAGRWVYAEGSLESPKLPEGTSVALRGVEADDPVVLRSGGSLRRDEAGVLGVVLGAELAANLGAKRGDVLRLVVLDMSERRPRFHYRSIRVTSTFTIGFAEFDARWILIDRQALLKARGGSQLEMVEFQLAEGYDGESVAARIESVLGEGWVVDRRQRLNQEVFAALQLQEVMLFFVLGLIVLVSTFNIASTLVILVREKSRDVAVLSSLGLRPAGVWWVFAIYGLLLGTSGILLGMAIGGGAALLITEFELVRFPPELAAIYFIDSVPFRLEAPDLAAIAAFSLAVTAIASALPALRAARLEVATALHDE